ncbi:interferon-induced very large GTPase 1-like [Leptodactylus fuscus]|uniref:interferon-induced very large GTPase 1-like n=1 Tax=Leptodactylus fuscus TaxID=238119 RepID=UPI003F4E95F5
MEDSKVKVAVRVRPMNQREIDLKAECVIHMEGKQTVLKSTSPGNEGNGAAQKVFAFDHCFWSADDEGPAAYTSQQDIFKTLGEDVLDSIFAGFNSCIVAYGQTGSGKTFSMMGTDDQPGLVPRLCSALFSRDQNHRLRVEASYLEIYNEKVRDLLYPTSDFTALNVREHKTFGPYVEGLSHHVVSDTEDTKSLIREGNKCRIIGNTKMNEHSSRSHAIFTLTVTQTLQGQDGLLKELLSKVNLVDLAGSECTSMSGAPGELLKESNNINKSLTCLGLVINSLAELSEGNRQSTYVNYKDSKLTWLLKNNLGGNSKTVMLATISPASVNYRETLSTLKSVDTAKHIVNKALVNEDNKSKAITELNEEVNGLREQLQQAEAKGKQELEEKLEESEKLLRDLKVSWEEKLKTTETSALERQKQIPKLGMTVEQNGISPDDRKCYLVHVSAGNSDQNELLLYHLGEKNKIGAGDSQDIHVTGPGIELEHCVINILKNEVSLTPKENAETYVNSSRVQTVLTLSHEDKIMFGNKSYFMLHKPNYKPTDTNTGHNVLTNQPEERTRPGNESIHDEDDRMEVSISLPSQDEMVQNISSKNKTSKEDERTPEEPSSEDNLITPPQDKEDKQGAHERQAGSSRVQGSSDQAVDYIRRSRKEITAALQKNFIGFLDECESKDIITREEHVMVENTAKMEEKAHFLVNVILQKDEKTCRDFLQCLQLSQEEENIPEEEMKRRSEEPKEVNNDKDKKPCFQDFLNNIEFQSYQTSKLTLQDVLDIGAESFLPGSSLQNAAWYFLRKLMALHEQARNISSIGNRVETSKNSSFPLDVDSDLSGGIHPLDLQCAIFHCSDHFLQQEMVSKMSMCQFSVPLLLPAIDGPDCTLMLWTMRGIVKKWRPQSLAESRGFQEEHLVKISMPVFSFVRLGKCRLSKSKILNQILSSTQHCQEMFVHRDMEGGNLDKTISMGLVEMSWYFPAGKGVFAEPVAFTNLRGELESNVKPFGFLAQISSVVVVFAASISAAQCESLLKYKNSNTTYLFIIAPEEQKSQEELREMLGSVMSMTGTTKDTVLVITRNTNEATTVKKIRSALLKLEKENSHFLSVEDMAQAATDQGIGVDESAKECQAARNKAKMITEEICDVVNYKGKTMKLQAQLLKDLARLEKELCQMKQQRNRNGEKYKSELRRQCDDIRRKQWQCHVPKGILQFVEGIGTKNQSKKFYFLSWLKYYLDLSARKTLKSLQEIYKEKYSQARDLKELTEIDQKISDSSLGIEHFLREVSQFYEVWHFIGTTQHATHIAFNHLPETVANLLLDGYPLELIDGDASRIPMQWVTDVLNKVNAKTYNKCRIRVITVLGVQSTGKSTLLNTMFGLQYPVASGRCTRGAFMTLIKVKENIREQLGCEFLLVIDTEGLKAPELDSLEGSYEHDNELATLVIGLSDITVINMAMENITEMKDILQIVIHSFLRMKEIGKKPICQFVHQNVSDVSAPEMNMRDRNKLLEQLNEMTRTVATMEKKPQYKVFSDVMEYDSEQHHWYIPGLWQGVPPMAPVSAGYSEHIAELKLNLLKMITQNPNKAQTIPQFIKWIKDLWNAVKHENFIFSFRNSLVASAYNKLSIKFSELEWKFSKLIHEWFINTETMIKNQSEDTLEDKGKECCIELENIISVEQKKLIAWVEDYFQQDKDRVHLIRYKEDFINSTKMLGKNLRMSSQEKYLNVMQIQKQQHKIERVRMRYIEVIEHRVSSFMEECRKKKHQLNNEKLKEVFETTWQNIVKELGIKPLKRRNIEKQILQELSKTMRDKGSAVNEKLNQIEVLPKPEEKMTTEGIKQQVFHLFRSAYRRFKGSPKYEHNLQSILEKCCKYSEKQAKKDGDYDDTYCKHLLNMIDDSLTKEGNVPAELELEIKLKILGHVVTDFQEMHNNFVKKNDSYLQLETLKCEYFNTFMNVVQEKNESQNLAKRVCHTCLKPAIIDHILRNLGIELVDDIIRSEGSATYTSRTFFQYSVLLDLLEGSDCGKYVEYSTDYKGFVKNWILKYIKGEYKNFSTIESKILSGITEKIRDLLNNPEMWDQSTDVEHFLANFQKNLSSDLVFPHEKLKAIIFRNSANTKEFIKNLNDFLTDTKEEIRSELEALGRDGILPRVAVKPQDELFKKVFGCGKQCPFCRVPCEAGGEDHKQHFASVHRPQGLGTYMFEKSSILCHDICTTCVSGNYTFKNKDTNGKPYSFKKYKDIYPDWRIQPDPTIEASDYWKFVLKEFNEQFANVYNAKPADYPKEWKELTKEMAKESLKKTFNM